MINPEKILVFLLGIHVLIAVLFLIRAVHKKPEKRKQYIFEFFIMLLCPFIGELFLFFTWLFEQLYFRRRRIDDLSFFSKNKRATLLTPDWQAEANIVPFEETLLVSVRKDKRNELLYLLKSDYQKSLSLIVKALGDEDTETSHYAASILLQEMQEFQLNIQKMQRAFEENPNDYEICRVYLEYLSDFLCTNIFSSFDERRYTYQLNAAAEKVSYHFPGKIKPELLEQIGEFLLKQGDILEAKKWAFRLYESYSDRVEGYRLFLRIYYLTENRREFFSILEKLRNSNIMLDQKTLEVIRFFS